MTVVRAAAVTLSLALAADSFASQRYAAAVASRQNERRLSFASRPGKSRPPPGAPPALPTSPSPPPPPDAAAQLSQRNAVSVCYAYRYNLCASCSQFDSPPRTSSNIFEHLRLAAQLSQREASLAARIDEEKVVRSRLQARIDALASGIASVERGAEEMHTRSSAIRSRESSPASLADGSDGAAGGDAATVRPAASDAEDAQQTDDARRAEIARLDRETAADNAATVRMRDDIIRMRRATAVGNEAADFARSESASSLVSELNALGEGELILFTVTCCANPAHTLTRPPSYIEVDTAENASAVESEVAAVDNSATSVAMSTAAAASSGSL